LVRHGDNSKLNRLSPVRGIGTGRIAV
jgi:hypothetical protein